MFDWQLVIIGSGNALAPNRLQGKVWMYVDQVPRRYAVVLNLLVLGKRLIYCRWRYHNISRIQELLFTWTHYLNQRSLIFTNWVPRGTLQRTFKQTCNFRFKKICILMCFLYNDHMTTSSNGNLFHVTGPLWGEPTGNRWVPLSKAINARLGCFLRFETPSHSL